MPGAANGPFPGGIGFQVAIDAADNLYVTWLASDQLYLMSSRTHGRSWSHPISIAGPRLHQIKIPALAAGPPGRVGVTYYASRRASDFSVTASITQTTNALASRPMFVTGALNDPKHPIFHDYGLSGRPRADFVGGAYDTAGTFWAGVVKQFGPPDANGNIATTGLVGRLVARR